MTFEAEGVRLHDERGSEHEPIRVPYSEMRFISVCTRKKAQEKGDWCVAVEIPLKYLAKKGAKKTGEPVLVQADAKPRLYQTLEKHGLALLGEQPPAEKVKTNCKFKPVKNFSLPNRAKRRRALVFIVISALLIVAAVPVGIFYSVSICSVLAAAGLLLGGKSVYSCIRAKAVFGVYLEGFFWQESSGSERLPAAVKRSLGFLLASIALWYAGYNGVTTWFSTYVSEVMGEGIGGTATCLMVATVGAIVSYIPITWDT